MAVVFKPRHISPEFLKILPTKLISEAFSFPFHLPCQITASHMMLGPPWAAPWPRKKWDLGSRWPMAQMIVIQRASRSIRNQAMRYRNVWMILQNQKKLNHALYTSIKHLERKRRIETSNSPRGHTHPRQLEDQDPAFCVHLCCLEAGSYET